MQKTDFKKELKHLYRPSKAKFSVVDVPAMHFLMLDGHGNPNDNPVYEAAVSALYAVAYAVKFASKKQLERDFTVMPLEGLWWVEDMHEFSIEDKEAWDWTMMIMQPEWITGEMVAAAKASAAAKKELPALPQLRFDTYHEELAVQIMYIGPYADEAPTIAGLHAFAEEQGYVLAGKHHEIYLSDPRRTAPEKLKTVIRQPVKPQT
ncbi:MAG: GyrI-like domain-containing protein [Anaerolineae bacterium]